jgi:hypothetical protein
MRWGRDEGEPRAGVMRLALGSVILSRESFPLPATVTLDLEGRRNVPATPETPQDELNVARGGRDTVKATTRPDLTRYPS